MVVYLLRKYEIWHKKSNVQFFSFLDDLYPLGVLPVLELENGEMMAESHAITRYLASEFDFYGKSNHDKAIIDQTLDSLKSVEQSLWEAYFFISDPKAKVNQLLMSAI